jgi:hypothetical protein
MCRLNENRFIAQLFTPGFASNADRLWEIALEQQGRADAVQFIRWRWRYGLSPSAAAEALGISRRQLAYYASGKHVCRRRPAIRLVMTPNPPVVSGR